jgi:hypothetical protein
MENSISRIPNTHTHKKERKKQGKTTHTQKKKERKTQGKTKQIDVWDLRFARTLYNHKIYKQGIELENG